MWVCLWVLDSNISSSESTCNHHCMGDAPSDVPPIKVSIYCNKLYKNINRISSNVSLVCTGVLTLIRSNSFSTGTLGYGFPPSVKISHRRIPNDQTSLFVV